MVFVKELFTSKKGHGVEVRGAVAIKASFITIQILDEMMLAIQDDFPSVRPEDVIVNRDDGLVGVTFRLPNRETMGRKLQDGLMMARGWTSRRG